MVKKICIIGPGVVGQATGIVLKENGFEVCFIGRNQEKIDKLIKEGFSAHTFSTFPDHQYDFDVTFITVATPTVDGKIDLEPIRAASKFLGGILAFRQEYHVVVVKSTVLPGTTENLVIKEIEAISGKTAGRDFGVCMNPEYLREVNALEDSRKPWLTLIGELDEKSGAVLESVYQKFASPIFHCSLKEAEMQKYIHNIYNAVKITFYNEMRQIAKINGLDAEKMFKINALSCEGMWNSRYGIRDAGPFLGHCLPKDTQALYNWAEKNNYDASLLKTTIEVNNQLMKKLNLKNAHVIGDIL
ncbi:MAG: nucleotide sugar dehydrogenase [Patescibacteria group bacterium]